MTRDDTKTAAERGDRSTLDIRGPEEHAARVRAMNLGGESSAIGAPIIISSGLLIDDPVEHDRLLRENPPGAQVPAQDPTPLPEYENGVPVGRVENVPAQGGPGAVRRVDDRTPDSALQGGAERPYNLDTSVAQRANLTGQDAAEETAEGKHAEGGARQKVADAARSEAEDREEEKRKAEAAANKRADERKKASEKASG